MSPGIGGACNLGEILKFGDIIPIKIANVIRGNVMWGYDPDF
jgi:hypothetical protein